jgi:murein L,D-transpeptidase YafK
MYLNPKHTPSYFPNSVTNDELLKNKKKRSRCNGRKLATTQNSKNTAKNSNCSPKTDEHSVYGRAGARAPAGRCISK